MTTGFPAGRPAPTAARTRFPGDVRFETHGGALLNVLRSSGEVADLARRLIDAAGVSLPGPGSKALPTGSRWIRTSTFSSKSGARLGAPPCSRSVPPYPSTRCSRRTSTGSRRRCRAWTSAYHLNHRRDGVVMYDPTTRTTLEGIGHYRRRDLGAHGVVCESTSVYPCPFDLGLVTGLARRFEASAAVTHAAGDACRARGADACAYVVWW